MSYNADVRKVYSDQLEDLKSQGIFKEERAICSPQDSSKSNLLSAGFRDRS